MNYCGNITKSVMLWEIFVDLLMHALDYLLYNLVYYATTIKWSGWSLCLCACMVVHAQVCADKLACMHKGWASVWDGVCGRAW